MIRVYVNREDLERVLDYLKQRPYEEVSSLIHSLFLALERNESVAKDIKAQTEKLATWHDAYRGGC